MNERDQPITLREAVLLYPGLMDELVTWGTLKGGEPDISLIALTIATADQATFQFVGDNNYRTRLLDRDQSVVVAVS